MAEEQRKLLAYLVDDRTDVRNLLRTILSIQFGQRIDFQPFSNGVEAYQAIQRQKPDLLITDIQMPEMSGDVLLETLVNDGIKIPTLVVSSATFDKTGAKAMFYSHRMYTPEQAEQLKLPVTPNTEEQMGYIDQQIDLQKAKIMQLIRAGEENPIVPYDFGVNVLTKPFKTDALLSQIKSIVETVYGK